MSPVARARRALATLTASFLLVGAAVPASWVTPGGATCFDTPSPRVALAPQKGVFSSRPVEVLTRHSGPASYGSSARGTSRGNQAGPPYDLYLPFVLNHSAPICSSHGP